MANCWRRRLTLRETTPGTMSHGLACLPGRRVADLPFWDYRLHPPLTSHAAQSVSQLSAMEATSPVQAPAIMSRQSSKTSSSP